MMFRVFPVFALLFAVVAGSPHFDMPVHGDDGIQEVSSVSAARARFLTRIREMLTEAEKLESAGRPDDAMLLAVRASRMLEALGGESAWPRGEISPVQVVAGLADRHGPTSLTQKPVSRDRSRTVQQADGESQSRELPHPQLAVPPENQMPSSESSNVFGRFPELPVASRSWVPIGEPSSASGDWTPVGSPADEQHRPVAQAGAEFPASPVRKFSDAQVGPIPVTLSPQIRPAAGIDIHASEKSEVPPRSLESSKSQSVAEPRKFLPLAEPVPLQTTIPLQSDPESELQPPAVNSSPVDSMGNGTADSSAVDELSEMPGQAPSGEVEPDRSQLIQATLIGASAGVLLVFVGVFLVRRMDRSTPARPSDRHLLISTEANGLAEGKEPAIEFPQDEQLWKPGSTWTESRLDEVPILQFPAESKLSREEVSEEAETESPQLQVYNGGQSSESVSEIRTGEPASEPESEVDSQSAPVNPAVPFRVVGTSVVLGEAESAKVDEELHARRQVIMQAVFKENVSHQTSWIESGDKAA